MLAPILSPALSSLPEVLNTRMPRHRIPCVIHHLKCRGCSPPLPSAVICCLCFYQSPRFNRSAAICYQSSFFSLSLFWWRFFAGLCFFFHSARVHSARARVFNCHWLIYKANLHSSRDLCETPSRFCARCRGVSSGYPVYSSSGNKLRRVDIVKFSGLTTCCPLKIIKTGQRVVKLCPNRDTYLC